MSKYLSKNKAPIKNERIKCFNHLSLKYELICLFKNTQFFKSDKMHENRIKRKKRKKKMEIPSELRVKIESKLK